MTELARSYQIICLKLLAEFVCGKIANMVPPVRGKTVADLEHDGCPPHMFLAVVTRRVRIRNHG